MAVTCQSFLVCSTDLVQKGVYRPTAALIRQGAPQRVCPRDPVYRCSVGDRHTSLRVNRHCLRLCNLSQWDTYRTLKVLGSRESKFNS